MSSAVFWKSPAWRHLIAVPQVNWSTRLVHWHQNSCCRRLYVCAEQTDIWQNNFLKINISLVRMCSSCGNSSRHCCNVTLSFARCRQTCAHWQRTVIRCRPSTWHRPVSWWNRSSCCKTSSSRSAAWILLGDHWSGQVSAVANGPARRNRAVDRAWRSLW